jgi:hypothetical protein
MVKEVELAVLAQRVLEEQVTVLALADLLGLIEDRLAVAKDIAALESLAGAKKIAKNISQCLSCIYSDMSE